MVGRVSPLPYVPSYPVMGLDATFSGKRWLDVWNFQPSPHDGSDMLLEVTLGHGDVPDPPWVMMCTDVNLEGFDRPEALSRHYSGIRSAATGAIGFAIAMSRELDTRTPIWEWAEGLGEPPWERSEVRVEGEKVPCWAMQWQDLWSAVADLGAVSVGVCGQGIDLAQVALEPVNDRIDMYALRR